MKKNVTVVNMGSKSAEKQKLTEHMEGGYGSTAPENLVIEDANKPGPSSQQPSSVNNVIKYGRGEKSPQYWAALTSTLGAFALGTVLGWISPAISGLAISYVEISWLGSLVFLGAACILGPVEYFLNKYGRKNTMLLLLIPFSLGWLLILLYFITFQLFLIYIGRFITGFASGGFCVTTPIYIAEIAQKEIRGALATMFPIMITAGIVFSYVVGSLTNITTFSIICTVVPLVFGAFFYFQPESPIYLVRANRMDEARAALRKLRGRNFDIDAEIREIVAVEESRSENPTTFSKSIERVATRKALLITCGVMILQQLTGIYPILSYSTIVLQGAATQLTTTTVLISLGIIQLLGNLIGEAIVDSSGRKYLLIRSAIWMSIPLILLGILFKVRFLVSYPLVLYLSSPYIPLTLIGIYTIAYSLGFGPVPWVLIGEMMPPEIKNRAIGIALFVNFLTSFLITRYFISIMTALNREGTFLILGFIAALSAVFVHFQLIETKGKSLAEIQQELEKED